MAKKRIASLGCLFWIALILLVIVIFLFNQQNIQAVLDRTGFLTLFQDKDDSDSNGYTIKYNEDKDSQNTPQTEPEEDDDTIIVKVDTPPQNQEEKEDQPVVNDEEKKPEEPPVDVKPAMEIEKPYVRNAKLYFATLNANEELELRSVVRPVRFKDTPLTETLITLLDGPSSSEFKRDIISLIPSGTRLNSVYVNGNTAYLDFNEEFRFNSLGIEGLTAQLKQIVYTSTEFVNISQVQFLISGKKANYLAQEGLYIGKPLSRESF